MRHKTNQFTAITSDDTGAQLDRDGHVAPAAPDRSPSDSCRTCMICSISARIRALSSMRISSRRGRQVCGRAAYTARHSLRQSGWSRHPPERCPRRPVRRRLIQRFAFSPLVVYLLKLRHHRVDGSCDARHLIVPGDHETTRHAPVLIFAMLALNHSNRDRTTRPSITSIALPNSMPASTNDTIICYGLFALQRNRSIGHRMYAYGRLTIDIGEVPQNRRLS